MLVTDLPNLSATTYGRAEALKQELRALVDYAQMYPTSREELETWFLAAQLIVALELAAPAP